MALSDDLKSQVATIFRDSWSTTSGRVVPVPSSVGLGNQAIEFDEVVVLYADLDGSTTMVDKKSWQFSAEVYKTYLHCAAKIIKSEDGVITAYDGDRIMAVFIGERMRSRAALAGLRLNSAVRNIINPAIRNQYPQSDFVLKHVVGVDVSSIRATRTGVRGDNDLVWVGRAANYAAKLTSLPSDSWQIWITSDVYNRLAPNVKERNGQNVWDARTWTAMNRMPIYGSNWGFAI
jgi:class 3 adenylate cyclase